MNISVKFLLMVASILYSVTGNWVMADKVSIPEIDSLDLGSLARDAAQDKKQLMVIYYKGSCAPCRQIEQLGDKANIRDSSIAPGFIVYKTNVGAGFDVTCPNGEQFADDDFMAIKGITVLPAVVVTDGFGNVMYVENGVASKEQLLAVGEKYKKRNVVNYKTLRTSVSY